MRPKVKICCISNIAEAKMGIEFGATALGLVANMPSGPGIITDEEISEIARTIPPSIASFLLTSETAADKIIQHHKRTLTNTIQIVDKLKVISLFSGSGGLDLGFLATGKFEIIFANDFNYSACETYAHNIGNHIMCEDISKDRKSVV